MITSVSVSETLAIGAPCERLEDRLVFPTLSAVLFLIHTKTRAAEGRAGFLSGFLKISVFRTLPLHSTALYFLRPASQELRPYPLPYS